MSSCESGYAKKKDEINADACKGSSSQELKLKENVPSFHFPREETHSELGKEWVDLLIVLGSHRSHLRTGTLLTVKKEKR